MSSKLFVTCPETLEPLLEEELKILGYRDITPSFRGVYVSSSMRAIYEINYLSHIACRVLYPIASFACFDKERLYGKAKQIDWSQYLSLDKTFAIDVTGRHPAFKNTLFAAQVLKDAICDHFREKTGQRPNVCTKNPDIQIALHLNDDRISISFDTSGEPLFKRGYRRASIAAPIQETYAAAFLQMAGYKGSEILLDPCCGSGTILIEAALKATHTPPGFLRTKWGFFHLPQFSKTEWELVKQTHDAKRIPLAKDKLFGYDISKSALQAATINCKPFPEIQLFHQDFRTATPSFAPTLALCNPPHGTRLDTPETLQPLYRALGSFFKQQLAKPAKAFVFTSSLFLSKEIGLKPTQRHVLKMTHLDCRLLEYEISVICPG